MSEERLITAAVITTGEKNDGKQLQTLIEKSQAVGMQVKTVIGDTADVEICKRCPLKKGMLRSRF